MNFPGNRIPLASLKEKYSAGEITRIIDIHSLVCQKSGQRLLTSSRLTTFLRYSSDILTRFRVLTLSSWQTIPSTSQERFTTRNHSILSISGSESVFSGFSGKTPLFRAWPTFRCLRFFGALYLSSSYILVFL